MRVPLLVANWKMHKTVQEAVAYVREFATVSRTVRGIDLVVAPPFTAIAAAAEVARNTSIGIGAQDVAAELEGAFTGEVSAAMIKDAGADYVIVGHSERRRLYGDTDSVVNAKIRAARSVGLTVIVCVGETIEERAAGETFSILDRHIRAGLEGLSASAVSELAIAYEPVWAIGTGCNATPAQAGEAHQHIRSRIGEWFGAGAARDCRVIYGGSVKPDNIASLMALPDVDGALVGGASLEVAIFLEIARKTAAAC